MLVKPNKSLYIRNKTQDLPSKWGLTKEKSLNASSSMFMMTRLSIGVIFTGIRVNNLSKFSAFRLSVYITKCTKEKVGMTKATKGSTTFGYNVYTLGELIF